MSSAPKGTQTAANLGEVADMEIETARVRLQTRIDGCLERHGGSVSEATTESRIGIGYLFARDIVRALEYAEKEIANLRSALTIAEDVLSRAPFSTQIWPNGLHPNAGIEKIRGALSRMAPQQKRPRIAPRPRDGG